MALLDSYTTTDKVTSLVPSSAGWVPGSSRGSTFSSVIPKEDQKEWGPRGSAFLSDFVRHPDLAEVNLREREREEKCRQLNDELISFFRYQAPPPTNHMSFPEITQQDGRFRPLKYFRRRSSFEPRIQHSIRLPDSAVAGTTIGGHRHIAISIPLEHSYFADTSRQQRRAGSHGGSSREAVRTFINDRGVVTVLRTVDEDYEPEESQEKTWTRPHLRTGSSIDPRLSSPLPPTKSFVDNEDDRDTPASSLPQSPSPPNSSRTEESRESSAPFSTEGPNTGTTIIYDNPIPQVAPATFNRLTYPSRTSSMRYSMMFERYQPLESVLIGDSNEKDFSSPLSLSSTDASTTYNTNTDTGPLMEGGGLTNWNFGHSAIKRRSLSSGEAIEAKVPTTEPRQRASFAAFEKKPVTPGPEADKRKSRKERVRERKMQDILASRASRSRSEASTRLSGSEATSQHESDDGQGRTSETPTIQSLEEAAGDHEGQPSVTPVTVVVNIQPSPPSQFRPRPRSEGYAYASGSSSPLTASAVYPKSVSPTPPRSPRAISPYKSVPLDRTSLSRRRERTVEREQECEECDETGEQLSDDSTSPPTRRCASLCELRIQDLEERMRRLEKNGEVWMRALVPALENLNRTLVLIGEGGEERCGRSLGSAMGVRDGARIRDSISDEGEKEEEGDREEKRPGEGEEAVSGLDTIEPLMRELHSGSRLSMESTRSVEGNPQQLDVEPLALY